MTHRPDCVVCRSVTGIERISPGPVIFNGDAWMVDHAYPTSLLGWVVLVLKRHVEALHELTLKESGELGRLQSAVAGALHDETSCQKEYSVCFGEAAGFSHLHFHIVPRAAVLDPELRGRKVFSLLKPSEMERVSAVAIAELAERLGAAIESRLQGP